MPSESVEVSQMFTLLQRTKIAMKQDRNSIIYLHETQIAVTYFSYSIFAHCDSGTGFINWFTLWESKCSDHLHVYCIVFLFPSFFMTNYHAHAALLQTTQHLKNLNTKHALLTIMQKTIHSTTYQTRFPKLWQVENGKEGCTGRIKRRKGLTWHNRLLRQW